MAPLTTKRRKLEHTSDDEALQPQKPKVDNVDTENASADEASSSDDADAIQSKPKHAPTKRRHDDQDAALYSGGLYKSSMFKLQVDELLNEVRPNYEKRAAGIKSALHQLKNAIEGIEDHEPLLIPDAIKLFSKTHKIAIPFPDPKPDNNAAYKLVYSKPSGINVVGSYALGTMVKSEKPLCVDMIVNMPKSLFQEKDYLNYRYFYKRAYYLATIAAGLHTSMPDLTLEYDLLNGNSLHPILVARWKASTKGDPNSRFEVHIIPAAARGCFAEAKLRPTKNSIRPKEGADSDATTPEPSPFYNSSLSADCNFESYLQLLHNASKTSEAFKDACLLGRIWLRQRGFGSAISQGGLGHFEWAALTALLLKGGGPRGHSLLSSGYSSYQMFKAVVQYLSTTDLVKKPVLYEAPDLQISKSDTPVFYDGPRGVNILYKMTPFSYELLRDEAKTSLTMLNDSTFDQFEATFITKADQILQKYDCIVNIPIPVQKDGVSSCDHKIHTTTFANRVFATLKEGLSDRVKLLDIKAIETIPWSIKSSGPSTSNGQMLNIAVLFDPANISRLVDHGPPAEDKKKALKFQKFWGEKAELRRFKDGSILESLVWSPGSTYSIFEDIVTYLIKRHFGAEISKGLSFIGEGFEKLLPSYGNSSKAFEVLRQAYNTFEKDIRDMESLPLQLKQLSAVDPQLRSSSIDLPLFAPRQPLDVPADVLIQFEGSGRWPDDVVAIQRTKIAFLLKIGELLVESNDAIITRLGIENEDQPLQNCAFLDVFYPSGATFRLRIHNEREQTLLERQVKDKSSDNRSREDAALALSIYKRFNIQLPLHTQSISTHCTRFPLLSPTIRLVKKWFDRHMLSDHVSGELIELLAARAFLQPYPWKAPSSAMSGFLRTLLFISKWDWRSTPLIVDFTGTMTDKDVSTLNTRLEAWRKIDPGMNRTVVFAASNHDTTGTAFTDKGPSKMVAARMTALARSACKAVKDQGLNLDTRSLFATSTNDYNFVIHLNPKAASTSKAKDSNRFKNLEVQSELNIEKVDYQPLRMFGEELESLYSGSIVFFRSATDISRIGGLWNPQTNISRAFKVNLAYAVKPEENDRDDEEAKNVKINQSAMLAEIARLGGDLVSRIEIH
ncbi:putative pre-rrna processing protein utp22 protein [Botrytis fragariae]|uniref:U3 small nucleolar RNA-associated protein 22 n=1 Tax=Botrytis fragariae TaxID=1964551 RepID=A0A8H6AZ84_9HELO|nr:putative pre-rrna processing protein utp22 protein [Botrytis fragariae]KAF5876503.1 putative pre-rrna processing protein utp22 protein [Botrytis fragariae]